MARTRVATADRSQLPRSDGPSKGRVGPVRVAESLGNLSDIEPISSSTSSMPREVRTLAANCHGTRDSAMRSKIRLFGRLETGTGVRCLSADVNLLTQSKLILDVLTPTALNHGARAQLASLWSEV